MCQWLLCLEVQLWEDRSRHYSVRPQRRLDGVMEDLLKARGPQLARIGVPHWCPAKNTLKFCWTQKRYFQADSNLLLFALNPMCFVSSLTFTALKVMLCCFQVLQVHIYQPFHYTVWFSIKLVYVLALERIIPDQQGPLEKERGNNRRNYDSKKHFACDKRQNTLKVCCLHVLKPSGNENKCIV